MKKVLFICTGNSCRSQMAEGFLKQKENYDVYSAGTEPAAEVQPNAIKAMQEVGIDISDQYPQSVEKFLKDDFDYVVTVCDHANETCPVFLGKTKHRMHTGFEDPYGKYIDFYRKIRDEIMEKMEEVF